MGITNVPFVVFMLANVAKGKQPKMSDKSSIENDITEIKVTVREIAVNQKQLCEDIKSHARTLYGAEGRNGLVGDVRDIRTTAGVLKWISGTGLITAVTSWLARIGD